MTDWLIKPGVTGLGLFGTTGEGHSLLWEEKLRCAETAVEAAAGRVQIFGGVTALGTREVIRQMRGLRDVGVQGALVGLPLWQTPTVENAVGLLRRPLRGGAGHGRDGLLQLVVLQVRLPVGVLVVGS